MLGALTPAVAVSVALDYLLRNASRRLRAAAMMIAAIAVVVESWTVPLRLIEPPRPLDIPQGVPAGAAIMELPAGVYEDAAAMYRSIFHGRRTVNGLSGYQPPHYHILTMAMSEGNTEALTALASYADIALFVVRESTHANERVTELAQRTTLNGSPRRQPTPFSCCHGIMSITSRPSLDHRSASSRCSPSSVARICGSCSTVTTPRAG